MNMLERFKRIWSTINDATTFHNDRKRRADFEDDFKVPLKSRRLTDFSNENGDYSDQEMDPYDFGERKKNLQKRRVRQTLGHSLVNGFPDAETSSTISRPTIFLAQQPISMATPLYVIDSSLIGSPIASSSIRQDIARQVTPSLHQISQTSSSRQPAGLRSAPDCLPLKTFSQGINTRSFYGPSLAKQAVETVASFKNISRNHRMGDLANSRRSPTQDLSVGSIFKKTHNENSRIEYANLLRAIVPDLYRPESKATQTVDLTEAEKPSPRGTIDLTHEKDESSKPSSNKSESNYESVNTLLERLSCRPAFTLKADDIKTRFEEERLQREEKITKEEQILKLRRQETENTHKEFRKRILEFPISYEDIILKIADDDEEEQPESYPELTQDQKIRIKKALTGSPDDVIISKFNLSIKRGDLLTLTGTEWLNDEVINFYMNLLVQRSEERTDLPKVYSMNTFFIPTLMSRGHAGVRRWTRKVDIFSFDLIPIPVHVGGIHWCMAIIRMTEKIIRYYDSMGNPNQPVLDALERYLIEEAKDKKKITLDTSDWIKQSVTDCPRQMNGSDCGVFSCMFAEHLTRGSQIGFGQSDMPYFREKMVLEISTGELLM